MSKIKRTLPILALLAVVAAALMISGASGASIECPASNPVLQENSCEGSGTDGWRLNEYDPDVAGFTVKTSYALGEAVQIKLGRQSTGDAGAVKLDVYRMGYYGNEGGRLIKAASSSSVAVNNLFSGCAATDTTTGLKSCAKWVNSYTIPAGALPASGVYTVMLTTPSGLQNTITFTVRDDNRTPKSDVLFVVPRTTYEAYNDWGGKSLYYDTAGGENTVAGTPRAVKVSFERPMNDPRVGNRFIGPDFYLIQWLEKEGYDVSYTDDVSVSENPSQLLGHKIDIVSGHSEYWSEEQMNGFFAARNAGVNIAAFSGNTAYWKVRYEDNYQTLVCYKTVEGSGSTGSGVDGQNDWGPDGKKGTADDALGLDQIAGTADDKPQNSTTTWRDNGAPPGDPNAPEGGRVGPDRPENMLLGNMYQASQLQAGAFPLQVPAANAQSQYAGDRIWRNTGVSTSGTTTIGSHLVGWEWDAIPTQAQYLNREPAGVKPLTNSTVPLSENVDWLQDEGRIYTKAPAPGMCACGQAVKYTAPSGALVFSSGTIDWAWGLAPELDSRIEQATYNILSDMGAQPGTPTEVTLDPPSGPQPPTSSFTISPTPAQPNQTVTFDGTSSTDVDGGIAKYEWDLDGNGTFETNSGKNPIVKTSYPNVGVYTVRLRVTDEQGQTAVSNRALAVDASGSGSYPARVLGTNGLLSYWRMDDTSGTTLTDAFGNNNATTAGTPTLGAPGAIAGDSDGAVSFDGLNDAATANVSLSSTTQITVEFWMKWNAFQENDNLAMEFTPNFNSTAGGFLIDPNAPQENGKFGVAIGNGSSRNNAFFNRPSAGKWHYYAFVLNSAAPANEEVIPYVDGKPVAYAKTASGTGAGAFANSSLNFMSRGAASLFGAGSLDEVALYSRALDGTTIANHYAGNTQAPTASFEASPNPASAGQTVSLDGSSSSSPNGTVSDYAWDLDGNGSYETDTGTTASTSTSFSSPGAHSVGLRVTDSAGQQATATRTVTVEQSGAGSYSSRVLNTAGLTHYWRLGESGGTSLADSAGNSPATVVGAPAFGVTGALAGDSNTAVGFNGTSDAASANVDLSGTSQLTLEFWMKWDAYANDDDLAFELTPNFNSNQGGLLVDPNAPEDGGKFAVGIGSGSTRNTAYFNRPSAGQWHHYAFVLDSSAPASEEIKPYVDGQPVPYDKTQSGTGAGNFANSALYFMSRAASALNGKGSLDEVAIYNRALPASAIAQHFGGNSQAPIPAFQSAPNPAQTGQQVSFDAGASSDPDGTIAKYEWDLDGNGSYETSTGTTPSVTKVYAQAGTFQVSLRVTDNSGNTAQVTHPVTVNQSGSGSYSSRVLNTVGLTDYWRLGETSGTTLADGKGGVNATTLGAPILGVEGALPNDTDKAVSFSGTNDAAQANLDLSGTSQLTLEFWLKWDAYANDDRLAFEFTPNFNSNPGGFLVDPNAPEDGGKFAVGIGSGSTRNTAYFERPSEGQWHYYAIVMNSGAGGESQITPYVDGKAVAYDKTQSGTGAGNFANSTLYFMSRAGSSLFGTGDLDEVAVYNRALSAATIDDHFSGTANLVGEPPAASFTVAPNPVQSGQQVNLDASASTDPDGTIAKYEWDLDGNGSFETSTGTNPVATTTYPSARSVEPRLRITDNAGNQSTTTRSLTVQNRLPSATFNLEPAAPTTNETVTYNAGASADPDGTIAKYEWDLDGNGSFETSTGTNPVATASFATAVKAQTVGLRVTDNEGATATTAKTFAVSSRPPVPSFTVSSTPIESGQAANFNAGASTDPDGTIAKYEWDLDGNGSYETGTGTTATTSRTYATPGTFTIGLRVTDSDGVTATTTRTLVVNNRPPTASFTISPNPVGPNQTVTFNGGASSDPDGTIAKYEWDLDGNGSYETSTGTTATATKSYATQGNVTVGLRVTDSNGATATTSKSLTVVNQAPVPSFTVTPSPANTRQTVTFNASASKDDGTIAKYEWDLDGNGSYETSSGATATVTKSFTATATLTIGLRVTDNEGVSASTSKALTINSAYRTAVLGTAGISDLWRLDETTGTTATDASGGNDNGTYVSGPSSVASLIGGETNSFARSFNGTSQYIDASPTPFATPSTFSAETWVRTSAAKSSGGYHFLISDSSDDLNNGFSLVIDSSNRPSFVVAREGILTVTRATATSSTTVAPNTTHYVVGTYDGSRARIYVDGVERASATFSGSPTWAGSRDLRLGRPISSTSLSQRYLQGTLDEPAVYTSALSAATVLAHYEAGKP
ncbi:MAG TPA: PKD domain-containing protein [Solirubrobacterales bacterium]|jgi:PKD repeat protein|nr:PKD domain-containing protein [Solirubrobacterales bacterium]